jgi:hypothetical protein
MVEIARAMLAGALSFLEGARSIVALYRDAGLAHLDKDIVPFVVVDSETDALPLGAQRLNWQPEALAKLQPEIDRWEAFARRDLLEACKTLIDRFGASSGSCEAHERNDAEGEN